MECGGGGGGGGGGGRQQLVEGAAQRLEHIVRAAEASVGAGDVARLAGTAQLVGGRVGAGVAALLLPLATLLRRGRGAHTGRGRGPLRRRHEAGVLSGRHLTPAHSSAVAALRTRAAGCRLVRGAAYRPAAQRNAALRGMAGNSIWRGEPGRTLLRNDRTTCLQASAFRHLTSGSSSALPDHISTSAEVLLSHYR
ncbi:uncharacterized protein LOC126088414 [Schistocerca cancellata]|uniref:uncharacterized protein LOC126088414 n=1 Tax=Schistocerca cancellata TaxID=274614 RepID=UPI002118031C|nr:uncharacterized protein LOC126088414 [Schistocerca cancellata]